MRRREREGRREVGLRLGHGLARQRVHQVEVDVAEDRERRLGRTPRLVGVVHATERHQVLRIEALDAERQPVDARGAKARELLALERPRIRLQRDLGVRRQRHARADAREQPVDGPAEKRLGVPPPMNTETTRRPQIDGSANSRSAMSASTYAASGASPFASCELKSQYGHFLRHHGMWT